MFVEALFSLIQTDMVASCDTALSSANFVYFILILTLRGGGKLLTKRCHFKVRLVSLQLSNNPYLQGE